MIFYVMRDGESVVVDRPEIGEEYLMIDGGGGTVKSRCSQSTIDMIDAISNAAEE